MSKYLSKYGVARHIYEEITKRGVVDLAVGADWTPSAGDVKISKDGGAAANVTNLPSAIAMGNTATWDFSLTATELQAAQIKVTISDSATKAVEDWSFTIETYGNASAQHAMDFGTATIVASSVTGAVGSVTGAVGSVTGAVGSVTGAVGSVTGNVGGNVVGSVGTLTEWSTTASTELAAVPASTATPRDMLKWLFLKARNKVTQTSTTQLVKANDGATTVGTSTVSDDGTTATRGVFS